MMDCLALQGSFYFFYTQIALVLIFMKVFVPFLIPKIFSVAFLLSLFVPMSFFKGIISEDADRMTTTQWLKSLPQVIPQ